jgi:hypothetical protein
MSARNWGSKVCLYVCGSTRGEEEKTGTYLKNDESTFNFELYTKSVSPDQARTSPVTQAETPVTDHSVDSSLVGRIDQLYSIQRKCN